MPTTDALRKGIETAEENASVQHINDRIMLSFGEIATVR